MDDAFDDDLDDEEDDLDDEDDNNPNSGTGDGTEEGDDETDDDDDWDEDPEEDEDDSMTDQLQKAEAQAIIETVERLGVTEFKELADGVTVAVIPNGKKIESLKELIDEYRSAPVR